MHATRRQGRGRPQKGPEELRKATNISLSPQVKEAAQALARNRGVSLSELIEVSLLREVGSVYRTGPTFYEFFAGGGMARLGLGPEWVCMFANDYCEKKQASYVENHGTAEFKRSCISEVGTIDLKGRCDLAWASFPCQDLSLAGNRGGLYAKRSGAFWPFWALMKRLAGEGRMPRMIAMENVTGLLSTAGGKDFADICHEMALEGFTFGAIVLDACHFVPQSRKRVFIVAYAPGEIGYENLVDPGPDDFWHPAAMRRAVSRFSSLALRHWVWLSPMKPSAPSISLSELVEERPSDVNWHSAAETERLLSMMTSTNRRKIEAAKASKTLVAGALYKRTRIGRDGKKVQRAEVRFDMAGCLRTPGGGSSRQILVVAGNGKLRTRLVSAREAARLMGVPDSYTLPSNYNDAYHLLGDGLAVPAVRFIRQMLLDPVVQSRLNVGSEAA